MLGKNYQFVAEYQDKFVNSNSNSFPCLEIHEKNEFSKAIKQNEVVEKQSLARCGF